MALEQELKTYGKKLPELLPHQGKIVVIQGEQIAGIFDTMNEALTFGYDTLGDAPFLAREIREKPPVLHFSRSMRPCPSRPGRS